MAEHGARAAREDKRKLEVLASELRAFDDFVAAHDRRSLAARIEQRTGCRGDRALRVAARALREAFRQPPPVEAAEGRVAWTDETLAAAGIGRWARPALEGMAPGVSLRVVERARSGDGSTRLLLRAVDGALVESVIIPSAAAESGRTTLCLSSQVGCARGCSFCETAQLGLERQLSAAEIVDQLRIARRQVEVSPGGSSISNIVFMGMGEPFDNLGEVVRSIELLSDPCAFGFAPSRITVSTVGVANRIETFFASSRAELAVSLNAPDDTRRARIMPITRRFGLAALRDAIVESLPERRRVLFQYALFAGFNDTLDDADALADYVAPIRCRVNVIPANPGPDASLVAPSPDQVDAFVARLHARGVTVLVRRPRRRDVGGACGQLAGARRHAGEVSTPLVSGRAP